MPMIRLAAPLACLLLAACSPQPSPGAPAPSPTQPRPEPSAATVPAPTPTIGVRLRAVGTEPFWAVNMDGNRLLYMTPENPDGTALTANHTPSARGGTWTGTHAGQPFTLIIGESAAGSCSDGMSETEYRYHVDFTIAGRQLRGCADDAEVLERPAP